MEDHPGRIPIDQCHHGWLYRIYSRNLNLGVYRQEDHGFVGIRHKMGARYLFTEFHWDNGPPFGTANPLEALCECPILPIDECLERKSRTEFMDNVSLFEWIEEQGQKLGITPESC
ncbi:hypothetical protein V7x_36260 [Crateriforma conspicua]|uniref:Uncharacterized protein n=1 Tax=Crateriforma conspicua TaxID=2527996 RepID=A0A5C6FI62_9PLAN|nr:hypothetical protein [Crateriforma conspicua]TWU61935.1 hypothetical protein V7x_36260 [Crateriforma conspicua]